MSDPACEHALHIASS